jgi:hypothetical protein
MSKFGTALRGNRRELATAAHAQAARVRTRANDSRALSVSMKMLEWLTLDQPTGRAIVCGDLGLSPTAAMTVSIGNFLCVHSLNFSMFHTCKDCQMTDSFEAAYE